MEEDIAEEKIENNNLELDVNNDEIKSVKSLQSDDERKNSLVIEDEEIKDDAVVVVDNSPKKERVIEDLPPVEEDIANVVGGSALEEDNIDEVHGQPIPDEVQEEPNLTLNQEGFDDPFLIVGKKLSSSSLKQDTLAYSISPSRSKNTLNDDDSLFKDVDNDLGDHHPSPEKKNPEPKEEPVEKEKISPRQQALAKLKKKSISDMNQPPPQEKNNDNVPPPEETPSSSSVSHQEKSQQEDKKNNPWDSKTNRQKKEKEKEKEKVKQPPASHQKPESELSAQEKVAQAEMIALKDKKDREEKLNLKKFKKNIEKLQEPGAQSDKESVDPAMKSKRSTRRGSKDNKLSNEQEDNSSVTSSRQPRKSVRRTSQEKSSEDGQEEAK